MKKWLRLTCIGAVLLGLLVSGCGSSERSTSHVNKAGGKKIVIGLDDNYPPVGFKDSSGNLVGSDIDMAKEAAKRLGVDVEFKSIDWAAKEVELKSGKVDAIWNGLTWTKEREKNILFTNPYQKGAQVIVVLSSNKSVSDKNDLAGKKVGIQEGSSAEESLKRDSSLSNSLGQLKKYPDMVSVFMDLKAGRIDAALVDEIISRYYLKNEQSQYIIMPSGFKEEVVAVGVALENKELRDKLNKILGDMYRDGTTKKIMEKWFGADISLPPPK